MKIRLVFLLVLSGIMTPVFGNDLDSTEEKIEELAHLKVSSLCEECEISVTPKWIPKRVQHLDSHQITKIQFTQVGLAGGYQTVQVFYRENGEMVSRDVQLYIRIEKPLPVAAKRIDRNEVISGDDLVIRMTEITHLQRIPVDSKEKIVNQSATRLIKKGEVVYASNLQKKPVIKAGDLVEMIYMEGGVEVALNCNAREDKAKGEDIRLYNEKTQKTYIGKVLTAKQVLWEKTL